MPQCTPTHYKNKKIKNESINAWINEPSLTGVLRMNSNINYGCALWFNIAVL
jgi:hypothetical protein